MSERRRFRLRPQTLAAKFLLIVFLGALLPLALVGVWLTHSAERSGTTLLRTQLESAADAIVAGVDHRWAVREGELQLLANNTAARDALTNDALSSADAAYLSQLARVVGGSIPSIMYVDLAGRERWSSTRDRPREAAAIERPDASRLETPQRTLRVELPVALEGRMIGRVVAGVRLASVVSGDSSRVLIPGARVTLVGANGVAWSSTPSANDGLAEAPSGWEVVRRSPRGAPLQLTLAAPSAPFVRPFEQAARTGLGLLMSVALIAFVLSAVLTASVTRSLAHLSAAATAVAAGDLERRVPESNDDEIGELARAFNGMTESLRRTVGELAQQRALAVVGEFAASLSHEVRNALTAVRVDLQHANRHLPGDNPGTSLVGRALDSVRRLDSTVTSALRVARGEQVAHTLVDLGVVVGRAMRAADPSFNERDATLEPLMVAAPVQVVGDASALEQLFLNLLINAAQAVSAGGHARVEMERENGGVTVKIIDTGDGIPNEQLASIGKPFKSSKPYGTGLGLPMARRIAVAHGGTLLVESAPSIGTTAVVKLPVTDLEPSPSVAIGRAT